MKEQIYAEIGIENPNFISTEIEIGKKEYRISKFMKPKNIKSFYIRIWILKKVLVIATNRISLRNKPKNKFKLIFEIHGENK